jgi:hypothetical protein
MAKLGNCVCYSREEDHRQPANENNQRSHQVLIKSINQVRVGTDSLGDQSYYSQL